MNHPLYHIMSMFRVETPIAADQSNSAMLCRWIRTKILRHVSVRGARRCGRRCARLVDWIFHSFQHPIRTSPARGLQHTILIRLRGSLRSCTSIYCPESSFSQELLGCGLWQDRREFPTFPELWIDKSLRHGQVKAANREIMALWCQHCPSSCRQPLLHATPQSLPLSLQLLLSGIELHISGLVEWILFALLKLFPDDFDSLLFPQPWMLVLDLW